MIGANGQYSFFRPVTGRDQILGETKCYPLAHPLYEEIWCRKVRRTPDKRVEVQTKRSSRPLVEEFLLIVPIEIEMQEDDIVLEVATGKYYLILGAENVSQMDQTWQCPIVRVQNVTKVAG